MKVAVIGGPYYPIPPLKYGGTERVIENLIKGLLELGHEPILLAPGDSKVDCQLMPVVDEALYFPKKDSPAFRKAVKKALTNTARELRKIAPEVDIIHSHDSHEFDIRPFMKYPNVTTIHGHIGFEDLKHFEERKNVPYISISKNQQVPLPDLNYAGIAYNGLDPSGFPFIRKPKDYLCFLGRFDLDKSPHLAIQLALALGMKIKLAGKIDLSGADYFKKEIKPYLKNPLVEYLGELNQKDKVTLVSHAKLNLHPLLGRREPFGLTVIEAGYCGTPTMAMNRASMPELIRDHKSGLLVEDFVEGYHRIDEAFALDREYISKRIRLLFNYRRMTKQYLQAYKKVIKDYQKLKYK